MNLHWKELTVALLMACMLWYGVSGSEKIESQIDVRVDYRGLPQGLVIRSGLLNKVSVRVRAPMGAMRSLSGKDYSFFIDLAGVHKGENMVAVNTSYTPFRSGIEIIDVTPSRFLVTADTLVTKSVPVHAKIDRDPPKDYATATLVTPDKVELSGASSLLEGIHSVTIPVSLPEPLSVGVTEAKRLLPLPEGVDANPPSVSVALRVNVKLKEVTVTRAVKANVPKEFGSFLRPNKVRITALVPESLAANAALNTGIRANVRVDAPELGTVTLPVEVSLPDDSQLIKVEPAEVALTLEQKEDDDDDD